MNVRKVIRSLSRVDDERKEKFRLPSLRSSIYRLVQLSNEEMANSDHSSVFPPTTCSLVHRMVDRRKEANLICTMCGNIEHLPFNGSMMKQER